VRFSDPKLIRTTNVLLVAFGALLLSACGSSEDKKYPVTGTVNVDGKPLADGSIKFVSKGDFDSLEVKDGKFSGEVREGEHKVEVYGYRESKNSGASEMYGADAEGSKENYIPAKYNTNSTEKKTVSGEGANDFKIEVKAK
jgi:hypothetical protein